ncbi:MAG TPA: endonuclease/exonuclease/phosphatase family protein [Nocardioides sp.]|nr:endonuclease/exonuclease/phosphatase family protein [Nocardioides sp.]
MVQHKAAAPRDPTIPLVLGLVIVIAVVLLISARPGGGDKTAPTASTPSTSPSATPSSPTTPDPQAGTNVKKVVSAPVIEKLHCVKLPDDTEITAVSFNVKSLVSTSAGAVAGVLSAGGADVVLLQEMKNAHVGNQPAAIAGILGMHYAFAQNVAYGSSGGYGTAVLSRFPIVSAENTHLPRPGNTQQRGLAHVVIDVDGKEVSIYNTHLQNLSESARIMQINRIAQIVALDDRPQIFGGDMNAHYGSPVMGIARTVFTDTWATVGVGGGLTHPASHLRGRIDYLMHANDGITPITSDVLPARLSDHMAVRAQYVIEGPGGEKCTTLPPGSTKKPPNADQP